MTKQEAFNKSLPKWPQCIIYGPKIEKEQALEIIRRTDSFFYGGSGNDDNYRKRAYEILKYPSTWFADEEHYAETIKANKEWMEKWGCFFPELQYLTNNWVQTAYIHGPHGWCRPDGTIEYHHNIGKWPEVEEVYDDLVKIATEFPFVELYCTLTDGEEDYNDHSVVSMHVKDGQVEFIDTIPLLKALQEARKASSVSSYGDSSLLSVLNGKESSISLSQLQLWAKQVFGDDYDK